MNLIVRHVLVVQQNSPPMTGRRPSSTDVRVAAEERYRLMQVGDAMRSEHAKSAIGVLSQLLRVFGSRRILKSRIGCNADGVAERHDDVERYARCVDQPGVFDGLFAGNHTSTVTAA